MNYPTMKVMNCKKQSNLYWSYQTTEVGQLINKCIKKLEREASEQLPSPTETGAISAEKMISGFDKMLQELQDVTQNIRRLQILRAWLCNENSKLIRNLLDQEAYQQYNETDLDMFVKQYFKKNHIAIS